ncbi:hypothetical protein HCN44_011297 [Aphidius gifuensis]|uniref:CFA20 domain-containing protein n=1 Tax=Aphidius gifuensis TaxID=684658 RepID=A0A834XX97_APHGI|nr:cilia- and flagella-associated protein 20-like [Aphidius gifuensis]KAF7994028.1 hypothetical protein HCN44_011297 [Aphidius gifuensis]
MFRDKFQKGTLSILYSCGAAPLEYWDIHVENGCIRRVTDADVNSLALEIAGSNVSTTYIYSPKDPKAVLGITLPFLIMIIKNLKKYFTFEITILDDQRMHRRFRASNFQSVTKVKPFSTSMPIGLSGGWNQIQFNLAEFTRRAYGTNYMETTRMQINANCRIRRIYFADRLYDEKELPEDYRLFASLQKCGSKSKTSLKSSKTSVGQKSKDSKNQYRYGDEEIDDSSMIESIIDEEESRNLVTPESIKKNKLDVHIPPAYDNDEDYENYQETEREIDDENTTIKLEEYNEVNNYDNVTENNDVDDDQEEEEKEEEILSIKKEELVEVKQDEDEEHDDNDEQIKKESSFISNINHNKNDEHDENQYNDENIFEY